MHVTQLPLQLNLRDDAIFDNYFVGDNAQLIDALKNFIARKSLSEQFIYCYGESGSGRTHLLQACCHLASENHQTAFYLPLSEHAEFSPAIFESLETQDIVCIDDVDAIVGDAAWEEALFYFYNRARENKVPLLLSAKNPPKLLQCALKDLQSRLSWGLVLPIHALNDEEKMQALQWRARLRGLSLSIDEANYLIHHYSRNMRDLFSVLEKLDHASLAAKRKLTIPFIKTILI